MKRIFAIVLVCVASFLCAAESHAQKYGVMGGATFSGMKDVSSGSGAGWHVGGTVQFKLPLGFSVQPSLLYDSKAGQVGCMELPVSLQWGPDLLIFRPFLEAAPYVGYALPGKACDPHFEYGLGLGGGMEVWRLQLQCRYNWNFENRNYGGVTLSLAFLFGK